MSNPIRRYMDVVVLAESWVDTIGGHRIYEIKSKGDFIKLLHRSSQKELRAFLQTDDTLIAWDAATLVHPEVGRNHFGLPLQLTADQIRIRPHGLQEEYVKQMYEHVRDSPRLKRIYGTLPEIWVDDDYGESYRADTRKWPDDDADEHWSDAFGAY